MGWLWDATNVYVNLSACLWIRIIRCEIDDSGPCIFEASLINIPQLEFMCLKLSESVPVVQIFLRSE